MVKNGNVEIERNKRRFNGEIFEVYSVTTEVTQDVM
jgi:hypothetical protein